MNDAPRPQRPVGDTSPSPDDFLPRVARGDEDAFGALYDLLASQVFGVAHRVLRNPSHAEEVTQEVFVEIWRTASRFDAFRGSVRTWATTLAHRRAVDRVRSEQAATDGDARRADPASRLHRQPRAGGAAMTTPGLPDVPDLHSLAAPYALDALPEPELREFEGHLATCSSCQEEVRDRAAVAANLAAATATEPPERLRARVLAAIRTTGQEAAPDAGNGRTTARPTSLPAAQPAGRDDSAGTGTSTAIERDEPAAHGHRGRRTGRRGLLALAAALVVLAGIGVGAGVVQYQQAQQRAAQAVQERQRVETVLAAPDSRTVRGDVRGGGRVTVVVSQELDRVVVLLDGLSPPPRGRTYQLWFIAGDNARSAGVVDVTGSGRVSEVLSGVGGANAFGISVEPRGGSKAPTATPVAAVPLA